MLAVRPTSEAELLDLKYTEADGDALWAFVSIPDLFQASFYKTQIQVAYSYVRPEGLLILALSSQAPSSVKHNFDSETFKNFAPTVFCISSKFSLVSEYLTIDSMDACCLLLLSQVGKLISFS